MTTQSHTDTDVADTIADLRAAVRNALGAEPFKDLPNLLNALAFFNERFCAWDVHTLLRHLHQAGIKVSQRPGGFRAVFRKDLEEDNQLPDEQLYAELMAAFGDADQASVADLSSALAAAGSASPAAKNGAALKGELARLGVPTVGTAHASMVERSDLATPMAGGQTLLNSLGALAEAARVAEQNRAAEQAAKEFEKAVARQREKESEAATHWRQHFRADKKLPPRLIWRGYPLPEQAGDPRADRELCRIDALAYLGDGKFLSYEGYNTPHHKVMRLITPCGCGRYQEIEVKGLIGLADALERTGDGSCTGNCLPSTASDDEGEH